LLVTHAEYRTCIDPVDDPATRSDVVLVVGPIYNDNRLETAREALKIHPGAVLLLSVANPA